jgi:hypothetical protein
MKQDELSTEREFAHDVFSALRKWHSQEKEFGTPSERLTKMIDLLIEELRQGNTSGAITALVRFKTDLIPLWQSILDGGATKLYKQTTRYMSIRQQIWQLFLENAELRGDAKAAEEARTGVVSLFLKFHTVRK